MINTMGIRNKNNKGDAIVEGNFVVSMYNVTRHYGGAEEGGWWYDRREFVTAVHATRSEEDAFETARLLNKAAQILERQANFGKIDGRFYQGRFSVAGHTDEVYQVDREIVGENEEHIDGRPRYE